MGKWGLFTLLWVIPLSAALKVGIAEEDITPPVGTPSAGYMDRKGEGMKGVNDPLLARSIFIDNGEKRIVFCSVDHLGFMYDMVQAIKKRVYEIESLRDIEIYLGSSHTHSGGGAFMNIPRIGEALAGRFDPNIVDMYIEKTAKAIIASASFVVDAKAAIGYASLDGISNYRGQFPIDVIPRQEVTVMKLTTINDQPLAVLFNYPLHPTVLKGDNRLFSADFVGFARSFLQAFIDPNVFSVYFNGAQGDIIPVISDEEDRYQSASDIGLVLARAVGDVWDSLETKDSLEIKTIHMPYSFEPKSTPSGISLPIKRYQTELNLIVLDRKHAWVTIPGELSTNYDQQFQAVGRTLGYHNVSVLGLVNDAHGYIILPESYRHRTMETYLSFGGEEYGEYIKMRVLNALSILKE